jgi:hypothetical protein
MAVLVVAAFQAARLDAVGSVAVPDQILVVLVAELELYRFGRCKADTASA